MEKIVFNPEVHPTYKMQFDKLTRAYIGDKVEPYNACACFIGNLLDGEGKWAGCRGKIGKMLKESENLLHCHTVYGVFEAKDAFQIIREYGGGLYTPKEIIKLEEIFLRKINELTSKSRILEDIEWNEPHIHHPNYENALFIAFEVCLDELKRMHTTKGEVIDDLPAFIQRKNPVVCIGY